MKATQHSDGTSTSTATATPGPWRFATTPSFGPVFHLVAGNRVIAHVEPQQSDEVDEANMQLIALAPTLLAQRDALLATVKQASEYLAQIDAMQPDRNHGSQGLAIRAQLRAAIALAGGGK